MALEWPKTESVYEGPTAQGQPGHLSGLPQG